MFVLQTKKYKKSLNKILRSGKIDVAEVDAVINLLSASNVLPTKYRDHSLTGEYVGYRECHVRPDVLLIYQIKDKKLVLVLVDIGSHSKLFS